MRAMEVNESLPQEFGNVSYPIQVALLDSVCVNCQNQTNGKGTNLIHYVVCNNAEVRWWHNKCNIIKNYNAKEDLGL